MFLYIWVTSEIYDTDSIPRYGGKLYHQLTRTHTVLTGRKTPMLLQSPCQYTKYCLRTFHCLNAFLLRQNCCAPGSFGFSSDFWFLSRRCVVTHQDEKGKKRRKDMLSGVCALVIWWYCTTWVQKVQVNHIYILLPWYCRFVNIAPGLLTSSA